MSKNHYETLGVSRDASDKDIRQAFRSLSMKYWATMRASKNTTMSWMGFMRTHSPEGVGFLDSLEVGSPEEGASIS